MVGERAGPGLGFAVDAHDAARLRPASSGSSGEAGADIDRPSGVPCRRGRHRPGSCAPMRASSG